MCLKRFAREWLFCSHQGALSDDSLRVIRTKTSKTTASCVAFFVSTLLKVRYTLAIRPEASRSPALPTLGSHDLTLTSFVARTTSRCATDACPGDRSRRQVGEEREVEDEGVNHAWVYYENRSASLRRPSPFFFFLLFGFFGRSSF